jgi:hypothetical protein
MENEDFATLFDCIASIFAKNFDRKPMNMKQEIAKRGYLYYCYGERNRSVRIWVQMKFWL